jgi:peptidoglycan/LPS O-acetylase OafA/YrhL
MKRIPSLDGLRAISITLVVLGHWISVRYGSQVALQFGILGVRIFFIISGYLITTLLLKEHAKTSTIALREFYVRRAYRILPAAAVFMTVAFVVYRHQLTWYHAFAAALYLANFDLDRPRFMGHLWSLSVEEQFYLLWPGVLKKCYRHRVKILLAVMFIAPIYRMVCYALRVPAGGAETFTAVADNLALGCLLAIFADRIPRIRPWLGLCMLLPIALVPMCVPITRLRTLVLLFALWPLMNVSIAGVLLHVVQTPYRFLNFAPIVWLGKISYSLYLWQQLFAYSSQPKPLYFLLFALALACLSYYLIEKPMLRMRDESGREGRLRARFAFAPSGD